MYYFRYLGMCRFLGYGMVFAVFCVVSNFKNRDYVDHIDKNTTNSDNKACFSQFRESRLIH